MKITALETIRIDEFPNLLWLQVKTDEGVSGLGETFYLAKTVEAYVHEALAQKLLGRNPLEIDRISKDLTGYLGFRSTGVEMRGNSALDIALWDIFGKVAGFLNRADELAAELLSEGITAMKIWPFDHAAEKTDGSYISSEDLGAALVPFEKIREAVGDKIDIMVEFHSMWQLLPAMTIARALAPFNTFWHEDPIKMDSLGSLKRYAEASIAPICASETLGGRFAFRDLLETGVAGVVMLDIAWCGGVSEAKKIAAMAEAWHLPIAPHDCTGPVVLTASTHLSLNAPNALIQESVRAYYRTWYRDLVTALPEVKDGFISVPPGPGLGLELAPDLDERFTVTRRVSTL